MPHPPEEAQGQADAAADGLGERPRSAVRAHVEHPFAHLKGPMGQVIRTIGLARATATVMLANMAYNMKRWCWLHRRSVPA
jgi:transposase, IS5 family